nr:calmodulin-binding protein 60 C isoform X3 [Aegilops tauschii subsp. strangulata]
MQRSGRGLQRSGSKRVLDPTNGTGGGGDDDHAAKRPRVPALASVIVEALKVDSLQKLCSSLEPILRRVVSEEVERALAKLGPARVEGRSSPKRIEGPDGTNLQLQFRSRLSLPLFTGGKVEGEQGAAIHVVLLDTNTGCVVTSGPESCAKLDVLVLEGDFNKEEDEGWTEEEFEGHIVKEREGKRPLLTGDLQVTLKEGVGTIGELIFTDNSSWIRSRKFRLGLRVASDFSEGIRVREAKTEAFTVKDHRGELYKKHYPPALKDDVWRLEKVGKDGAFHKKLNGSGIYTVEDFLRLLVRDQQRLRSVYADTLVKKAYEDWMHAVEYDGKALLGFKQKKKSVTTRSDTASASTSNPALYGFVNAQKQLLPGKAGQSTGTPSEAAGVRGTYNGNLAARNTSPQNNAANITMQYERSALSPESQFSGPSLQTQTSGGSNILALEPAQQQQQSFEFSAVGQSMQPADLNPFDQWSQPQENRAVDDYLMEEIRLRSHEILENDEMQQMLRILNMGGASTNMNDDGFTFPPYMQSPSPNLNFEDDRTRPPGKAVVGWLKIKAAMRWGIFVRKKAAERRAQLVELDDD